MGVEASWNPAPLVARLRVSDPDPVLETLTVRSFVWPTFTLP